MAICILGDISALPGKIKFGKKRGFGFKAIFQPFTGPETSVQSNHVVTIGMRGPHSRPIDLMLSNLVFVIGLLYRPYSKVAWLACEALILGMFT